jgi:hypothetical protein
MFINGGSNITIDSNKWSDDVGYPIGIEPTSVSVGPNITIQNNWFELGKNNGQQSAVNFSGYSSPMPSNTVSGVTIRYNSTSANIGSFATAFSISSGAVNLSNIQVIGNIGANNTCYSGWTYAYNIWSSANSGKACAATDRTVSTLPYVNGGIGTEDFHLTCGSIAQTFVTPNTSSYQLNYDIDGNVRSPVGPRTAGASAEASCGT